MTFVNPTYLWGLLALALPLAIHLLNRGDVKTIKVGSIKFLTAQETKQTKNIKLNELVLLFLRILIVALLVLILANPKIEAKTRNSDIVYVIEPSLLKGNLLNTYLNDLPEKAQIHLLSSGFPEFEENESLSLIQNKVPNYWQLVHEMKQLKADSIVVFSESFVAGVKGMRPSSARKINWVVVNDGQSRDKWIEANELGDKVQLTKLKSNSKATGFETNWVSKNDDSIQISSDSLIVKSEPENATLTINKLDTLLIEIVHNREFSKEAIYFEKAFRAISAFSRKPISVKMGSDYSIIDSHNLEVLVWLLPDEIPEVKAKRIRFEPDSLVAPILIEGKTNNDFQLTQRLDLEKILEGKLTQKLTKVLGLNVSLDSKIALNDKRVMPSEEIQPILNDIDSGKKAVEAQMLNVSAWLWLLLVLVLIVERLFAKFRKQ